MELNKDQKLLLATAVKVVNTASKQGKDIERLIMQNGIILTIEAKSPALVEEVVVDEKEIKHSGKKPCH